MIKRDKIEYFWGNHVKVEEKYSIQADFQGDSPPRVRATRKFAESADFVNKVRRDFISSTFYMLH